MSEGPPPDFKLVHVAYGKVNHLDKDGSPMRTLCGQGWVATVEGPPSTERRTCLACLNALGGREVGA